METYSPVPIVHSEWVCDTLCRRSPLPWSCRYWWVGCICGWLDLDVVDDAGYLYRKHAPNPRATQWIERTYRQTPKSKWTCRLQNLGCYATMRVRNKDFWHLWPAKMLDGNLDWLWTERYRGCNWPVARQSEMMRSCMHAGGGHFEHMPQNYCLFVLCGSSEHFMKLSM